MDFVASFLDSFASPPRHLPESDPKQFLGRIFPAAAAADSPLFRMLAGGGIHAASPWSFDIRYLDCFLILYTRAGCGKLHIGNHVYTLSEGSLLFLDCRKRFRLDIAIEPWNYQILFLTGSSLDWYYGLLKENKPLITQQPLYSPPVMTIEQLLSHPPEESLSAALHISALLDRLICDLIGKNLTDNRSFGTLPPYLEEIRALLDNHFKENYTLNQLEKQFGVSKYRLCREFREAYELPPLQYLNRRRIEIARHFLLTTNLRVHEIGSLVGIDTTNHFINLFKKYTGCTPGEYRQRAGT